MTGNPRVFWQLRLEGSAFGMRRSTASGPRPNAHGRCQHRQSVPVMSPSGTGGKAEPRLCPETSDPATDPKPWWGPLRLHPGALTAAIRALEVPIARHGPSMSIPYVGDPHLTESAYANPHIACRHK